jgi:hypothetical protein
MMLAIAIDRRQKPYAQQAKRDQDYLTCWSHGGQRIRTDYCPRRPTCRCSRRAHWRRREREMAAAPTVERADSGSTEGSCWNVLLGHTWRSSQALAAAQAAVTLRMVQARRSYLVTWSHNPVCLPRVRCAFMAQTLQVALANTFTDRQPSRVFVQTKGARLPCFGAAREGFNTHKVIHGDNRRVQGPEEPN